mgnify:FL=1
MRLTGAIVALFLVTGCAHKQQVRRDANTYVAEVLAGLQREKEAAAALHLAAQDAVDRGEMDQCLQYAAPALVIDAKAQPQAYRALWLAGMPYPLEDGSLPAAGQEQPDPGPAGLVPATDTACIANDGNE